MGPSTLASWALLIAQCLEERGGDPHVLFRRAGISLHDIKDPNARCPLTAMKELWTLAVEATGDPCLGLEVGRAWHPTTFHALGYAALACSNLRETLMYMVRYGSAVSTGVRMELLDEGPEVSLRLWMRAADVAPTRHWPRAGIQAGLAAIVVLCRATAGAHVHPQRVTFTDPDAVCLSRLEQFFECPVSFGAQHDALAFDAGVLSALLPTSHPPLLRVTERALNDYLARVDSRDVLEQVRSWIVHLLPSGQVSQAAIARSLNVSVRTLQRKLLQRGATFRGLLDDTRKRLAEQYVQDSTLAQVEIAYLLGFSEGSSLSRAMGRWGLRTTRARRRADRADARPA